LYTVFLKSRAVMITILSVGMLGRTIAIFRCKRNGKSLTYLVSYWIKKCWRWNYIIHFSVWQKHNKRHFKGVQGRLQNEHRWAMLKTWNARARKTPQHSLCGN
jgi:hypothetical protein